MSSEALETKVLYEIGIESIVFIMCGIFVWIVFVILICREQSNFRKRRRGLANFHEQPCDDEDEDSAKYMISFFSDGSFGSYKNPPSSPVTIHLLGSLYPGKFHELKASSPEQNSQLFPPFGAEKFLVTEDVNLGRIIGIIIQNEVSGPNPYWDCSTVIVRDVQTNEAWFFHVDSEIGFPPRLIIPATQKELCAFKFSFRRRVHHEIRNGQFGYFSFLFRSKVSVYSYSQRWITSVGLYLLFFVTCFLFLDFVFSPGHTTTDPTKYGEIHQWLNPNPIRPKPDNPNLLFIYGESAASYWVLHVVIPALVAALITSFLGFLMISFFREASKYEKHFSEMDYVIGTALLEQIRAEEVMKQKVTAFIPPAPPSRTQSNMSLQIEGDVHGITDEVLVEEIDDAYVPQVFYPVEERDLVVQRVRKKFVGFLRGVKSRTLVLMKWKKITSKNTSKETNENLHATSNPAISRLSLQVPSVHSVPATPYPDRSEIFEPGGETPPLLEPDLSPYEQRKGMRRLFVATTDDDSEGLFRRGSGAPKAFRLASQVNWSTIRFQPAIAKRKISFDLAYHKPSRKWYQPIPAWTVVIIVILLSIAFITVVSIKGKFHHRATEDQFIQIFMATLVAGILIGTFIIEPLKIILIALYHAAVDRKLYKRIQTKTRLKTRSKLIIQNF